MFRFPVVFRMALPALAICTGLAGCAQDTSRNSYVVFFDNDSVSLTPTAAAVIQKAADAARAVHAEHIEVTGSAGLIGDPDTLKQLASNRAKVVVTQLQEDGVYGANIVQTSQIPQTVDDSRVALRRVSIKIDAN